MKARFERSESLAASAGTDEVVTLEAEWFQLTYDRLRIAPDGETVAMYDPFGDVWRMGPTPQEWFSDVVLHNDDE